MCGSGRCYPFKIGDRVKLVPAAEVFDDDAYEAVVEQMRGPPLEILAFGWFGNLKLTIPGGTSAIMRVHRDHVRPSR